MTLLNKALFKLPFWGVIFTPLWRFAFRRTPWRQNGQNKWRALRVSISVFVCMYGRVPRHKHPNCHAASTDTYCGLGICVNVSRCKYRVTSMQYFCIKALWIGLMTFLISMNRGIKILAQINIWATMKTLPFMHSYCAEYSTWFVFSQMLTDVDIQIFYEDDYASCAEMIHSFHSSSPKCSVFLEVWYQLSQIIHVITVLKPYISIPLWLWYDCTNCSNPCPNPNLNIFKIH